MGADGIPQHVPRELPLDPAGILAGFSAGPHGMPRHPNDATGIVYGIPRDIVNNMGSRGTSQGSPACSRDRGKSREDMKKKKQFQFCQDGPRNLVGFPVGYRGSDWDHVRYPARYRRVTWVPVARPMGGYHGSPWEISWGQIENNPIPILSRRAYQTRASQSPQTLITGCLHKGLLCRPKRQNRTT